MKNAFALMTGAGLALAFTLPAQAADIKAGQSMYQAVCASCHQADGRGQAIFPALKGQDAAWVTDKLERYRAGEQVGDNTALMRPHAQSLSDADIANVAAFIETEFAE
ncbi:c-type cytochrome [Thioalkalivibrio sp. AKL17]|uniref:c-type cytochrome n=1 Tax=Thioalkalivibrio sp. AKL17 TaxID=1158160 RepID=UPI0003614C5A|nr:c-type cytochrome [Thioalkalivibrio sp. AKL17]